MVFDHFFHVAGYSRPCGAILAANRNSLRLTRFQCCNMDAGTDRRNDAVGCWPIELNPPTAGKRYEQ